MRTPDAQKTPEPGSASGRSPRRSSHVPAKRKRYTPAACDECARRKVKCDGQTPCQRCTRNSADCVYARRSTEHGSQQDLEMRNMNHKIEMLQEQISRFITSVTSGGLVTPDHVPNTPLSTTLPPQSNLPQTTSRKDQSDDSNLRRQTNSSRKPQYLGLTSSAFTFGVAKNSLRRMGIQTASDPFNDASESRATTPIESPVQASAPLHNTFHTWDPLRTIPKAEVVRLIGVYEEESGSMYCFLDIKLVSDAAEQFFASTPDPNNLLLRQAPIADNKLSGGILDILKLVIAIALVIEGRGQSTLSQRLLENVESGFFGRPSASSVDMLEIQAWTLMSILQFHRDEEALAWRAIGLAARAALELGLHRREMYFAKFADSRQRHWANRLFWSIYVLDRRWSFGTGLPFAIQEHDIDPELPEPNNSPPHLLKTMVSYGHIGSKVWKAASKTSKQTQEGDLAYLDYQVRCWQSSIAAEYQLDAGSEEMLAGHTRAENRVRVLFRLRANQMRLLIHRRVLLDPTNIVEDLPGAQRAVALAKESILIIDRLNRLSDIYFCQQTCFNYFLGSALAVLFLAVCHAPMQFNETCRNEFFLALELIRGLSGKSYVAQKLWKTIKHLKAIGPKLGIFPNKDDYAEKGRRDNATTQMQSTVSTHISIDEQNAHNSQQQYDALQDTRTSVPFEMNLSPAYSNLIDGNLLSCELSTLFDAINPNYPSAPLPNLADSGGLEFYNYGTAEDLSRSLLDLM